MDGLVNVLKPPGMTSHSVVSTLRRLLGRKKIGHTGTLDPGAAGVLLLCVGKATRLVPYLVESDKSYVAEMTLGLSTSTQDASGETVDIKTDFAISPHQLADALGEFMGAIDQIPPMVSAVRKGGKRLYELARSGETIERDPRRVRIKELHINKVWCEGEDLRFGSRVLFYVVCSKGTYIRTLCHDVGERLGSHAHLSFLSRTRSGSFSINTALTLEELGERCAIGDYSFVLPMEQALPSWPKVVVSPLAEERVRNGNAIAVEELVSVPEKLMVGDEVLLLNLEQELLALADITRNGRLLCRPTRVLKGREGD